MRTIKVPEWVIKQAVNGPFIGRVLHMPVHVDWPELQLTEGQVVANSIAFADGEPSPYPNLSMFIIELPYVREGDQ